MATSMEVDDDELIESGFGFEDHEATAAPFVMPPLCDPAVLYTYDEVEIKFPKTAYDSQEEVMQKVIRGLRNAENCLLESPTGTGKTLALLCPILAWLHKGDCEGPTYWDVPAVENGLCTCLFDVHEDCTIIKLEKPGAEWELCYPPLARVQKADSQENEAASSSSTSIESKIKDRREAHEVCRRCRLKYYKSEKPPKVYYTTRTVGQSVGNLRQFLATHYRDSYKVTILASRGKTCIEENIMNARKGSRGESASVDDECTMRRNNFHYNQKQVGAAQKRKTPLCKYFQDFGIMKQKAVEYQNSQLEAVDIEDIRKDGRAQQLCPYYLASFMHEGAEIVFCTFNYLLDESIRESSKIDLLNSVVVFDEAHNIENTCKAAASKNLSLAQLADVILKLQDCLKAPPNNSKEKDAKYRSNVSALEARLQSLQSWVKEVGEVIPLDESKDSTSKEFHADDIKEMLTKEGSKFRVRDLDEMTNHLNEMYYLESDSSGSDGTTVLSSKVDSKTTKFIRHLVSVLKFLVDPSRKDKKMSEGALTSGSSDFVICFEKTRRKPVKTTRQQDQPMFNYAFKVICLNPAIAFNYIKKVARTIIVASGTLHPMKAFQSELATPFPERNRLSARHVVPKENVWTGIFHKTSSLNGPSLNLKKNNQDRVETLDEVGAIILQICGIVPFGVLVFVPSYEFLTNLQAHWSKKIPPGSNGPTVLHQLRMRKKDFYESQTEEKFKRDLHDYKTSSVKGRGAIYFGVFRGKVSEGVDFADNQARAVITLGIPYLNFGCPEVIHKMAYNTIRSQGPDANGIQHIGGDAWYKAQAFRALNQAFGRVIRHQNDWGAICIIEERLQKKQELMELPKWVRDGALTLDVDQNMHSLYRFIQEKMKPK